MAGLNDFARRMSRIAVQVEGSVEQAVRDCSKAVARGAVEATPVDTGLARSNWVASLDAPAVGVVPAHVPGVGGSTGDANALAAIGLAESAIDSFETMSCDLRPVARPQWIAKPNRPLPKCQHADSTPIT